MFFYTELLHFFILTIKPDSGPISERGSPGLKKMFRPLCRNSKAEKVPQHPTPVMAREDLSLSQPSL